jgi:hypothetical protein
MHRSCAATAAALLALVAGARAACPLSGTDRTPTNGLVGTCGEVVFNALTLTNSYVITSTGTDTATGAGAADSDVGTVVTAVAQGSGATDKMMTLSLGDGTTCIPTCNAGYYATAASTTCTGTTLAPVTCIACPAGAYVETGNAQSCIRCAAGQYGADTGMSVATEAIVTAAVADEDVIIGVQYTIQTLGDAASALWTAKGADSTPAAGETFLATKAANDGTGTLMTTDFICTSMTAGEVYTIRTLNNAVGAATTDYTLWGAANNNVGTSFTAKKVGTGCGTGYVFLTTKRGCQKCFSGKSASTAQTPIIPEELVANTVYYVTKACTDQSTTTCFMSVGASSNAVGTIFTATGPVTELTRDGRAVTVASMATEAGACTSCSKGTYETAIGDANGCIPCALSTYLPTEGGTLAASCLACPLGRYSPGAPGATGAVACIACPMGTYGSAGTPSQISDCILCAVGKMTSFPGTALVGDCISCTAGKYSLQPLYNDLQEANGFGTLGCIDCPTGQYSTDGATAASATTGTDGCLRCATANQVSAEAAGRTTSTTCADCPAGKKYIYTTKYIIQGFDTGETIQECENCPTGTYSSAAQNACIGCTAGLTGTAARATQCAGTDICGAGKYRKQTDLGDCIQCPHGTYTNGAVASNHDDADDCIACTAGQATTTPLDRADGNCGACTSGKFSFPTVGATGQTAPTNAATLGLATHAAYPEITAGAVSLTSAYEVTLAGDTDWAAFGAVSDPGGGPAVVGTVFVPTVTPLVGTGKVRLYSGCQSCARSKYRTAATAGDVTTCIACEAGKWSDAFGRTASSDCKSCAAGFYGQAAKVLVKAVGTRSTCGTYAGDNTGNMCDDGCTACMVGSYRLIGDTADGNTAVTGEAIANAPADCKSCGAGKYADTVGTPSAAQCKDCPAGKRNSDAATTATNHAALSNCADCSAGKYSSARGLSAAACTDCAAGQSTLAGQTACADCAAGTRMNAGIVGVGAGTDFTLHCGACVTGQYSTARTHGAACIGCPIGKYMPDTFVACISCPTGRFSAAAATGLGDKLVDDDGTNGCLDCTIGKTTSGLATGGTNAAAACTTACVAGTYKIADATGLSNGCIACPVGKYNPGTTTDTTYDALIDCLDCAAGQTSTTNSQACTACAAGEYSEPASAATAIVPNGAAKLTVGTACDCAEAKQVTRETTTRDVQVYDGGTCLDGAWLY